MSRRRLSLGELLSAAAGLVLVLSTLLPWFQEETTGGFLTRGARSLGPRDLNAWQSFVLLAIPIVLVAGVPVWQALLRVRDDVAPRPQFLVGAGAVAVTLVLAGAASELGARGQAGPDTVLVSTTAQFGLLVGVLAALLMAAGGVAAMWSFRPVGRAPDER